MKMCHIKLAFYAKKLSFYVNNLFVDEEILVKSVENIFIIHFQFDKDYGNEI